MKLYTVLTLCLLLSLDGAALAEARPASHSGTSSSYKSGFSSQKSNSASRTPSTPRSSPGAFGRGAAPPPAPPPASRGKSALSRDMEQSAAQDNARRTLEQRRAEANPPRPLPPLNDTLATPRQPPPVQPQPQPNFGQPAYGQQRGYPQQPGYSPAPAPQQNNGLMYGLMGFMLGRSMAQPAHAQPQPQSQPQPTAAGQPVAQQAPDQVAAGTGATVGGMPSLQPAEVPVVAPPAQSFGASVLRTFLWLVLLSLVAWLLYYSVRKYRRLRSGAAASGRNYSFERN